MPNYVSPFTGTVVTPTDVSYLALTFTTDQTLAWPAQVNPPEVPAARIIDCVAGSTGHTIYLPPADQGTLGADILFRNLGAFPFFIKDADGGQSVTVPVGISKYVYLTDNTSVAGEWQNVTFAAGTSYADATTLAGLGLTTIDGKLATTQNTVTVTSTPVINDASRGATFVWDSGAGQFDLPNPQTLSSGWYIMFRNNGTGSLQIVAPDTSTINGELSITTNPQDSGIIMYSPENGGYVTVGWVSPSNTVFSAATYDVDAVVGNTLSLVNNAPIIQSYVALAGTRTETLNVILPTVTQLYILVNDTNESGYALTFQNDGSSQPPYALSTGEVVVVLSDGLNIYPLTGGATGLFYANNGSAGAPAYSFAADTASGMYLVGTSVLGLSANGTQIVSMDNSNLLQPLMTINARLKATLINGGVF